MGPAYRLSKLVIGSALTAPMAPNEKHAPIDVEQAPFTLASTATTTLARRPFSPTESAVSSPAQSRPANGDAAPLADPGRMVAWPTCSKEIPLNADTGMRLDAIYEEQYLADDEGSACAGDLVVTGL